MPLLSINPHNRKGFTLVEMMVVIAIIGAVGVALSGMIQFFYQSNAFLLEQTSALDNARRGMRTAIGAIREASYGDDGSYPIKSAATSTLTFYSDIDKNAAIERVQYVLIGTTFYQVVTSSGGTPPSYVGQTPATTTVATYVRNGTTPVFTYYDSAGAKLSATSTDAAKIASVSVSLMVDLNPNRAPNVFTLTESATVRNLRTLQ